MSAYKNIVIYYFSGTGNSGKVASWIAETAKADNADCQIINIAAIDRLNIPVPQPGSLVIFISPVHGFNYPPVMVNFLLRFPKGNCSVALMNTRAGMLIGKWVTPGLTGAAFNFAALILKIKGYSIKAMYPVDMPSNWISVHPGLNGRTVKFLHAKNKERISVFSERLLSGKSDYRALREIIQDIAITPVSLMYYFVGRFMLAKTYYASADCNNCSICIKNCPVKAIEQVNGKMFWSFRCESCMRCMSNCPKKAIETAHGFIILLLAVIYPIVIKVFYDLLLPYVKLAENGYISFILENLVFLGLLAVSYRIAHYMLRFRIFNKLMVYTSLTKYRFWGRRYKALKNF
ncbi:MAG: EFR1 family ferrodoxin [Bacteroidota bacterium]